MTVKHDFLIVGAGPFGAAFARTAADLGKTCLVIDKREHIAGNVYSKKVHGIDVHMYGAHIFHTDNDDIWQFVNRFGRWKPFQNNPLARIGSKVYSFPINLMTLHQLWGVITPAEARARLDQTRIPCDNPQNAEEFLLDQVGREIYELFFRGYTQKQWFKEPRDLPASIVTRLPFRLTFDDSYFHARHQAIPVEGYTSIFAAMLEGIDVDLGVDFFSMRDDWRRYARQLVFTGPIDRFYDHTLGRLEYRSLRFEFETHTGDFQGHAVFNYPELDVPYIRSIEHKHFLQPGPKHITSAGDEPTVVSYDFPIAPDDARNIEDPQYPIRDAANSERYSRYADLARGTPDIIFGGRLGEYRYYDIDQAIGSAIAKARRA